jgi:hypothetical protein
MPSDPAGVLARTPARPPACPPARLPARPLAHTWVGRSWTRCAVARKLVDVPPDRDGAPSPKVCQWNPP